ncbi:hypothetical protein GO009_09230 [Muricauda sp. TY007]|uniref:hypothetical protein n=1 Tax=Allomuricauda sp. TY007 TaxID=2683200 RepID=UPI0013C057A3|nr:hypothetical protein [Muricauda sp. TY007]NDV16206.1 hypothetical protein [Muricauda sp. TY007]
MRILPVIIVLISLSCIAAVKKKHEEHTSDTVKRSEVADAYFSKLTELGDFNGVGDSTKKGTDLGLKQAFNMQSDMIFRFMIY